MKKMTFLLVITGFFIMFISFGYAADAPNPAANAAAPPTADATPPVAAAPPAVVTPHPAAAPTADAKLCADITAAKDCDNKTDIPQGVCVALALKKAGTDESKIVGRLLLDSSYKYGYAKEELKPEQQVALKGSFSDDFIDNWKGVPQYVTIGASAIYLIRESQVIGAGVLRIFFFPRNYYANINILPWAHSDCDKSGKTCANNFLYDFNPMKHDAWIHRFAFTLGLTTATGTDTTKTSNYYLAGLAYEVNRSALLNLGWGVSTSGSNGQIYLGITLDSNFLKVLGITK